MLFHKKENPNVFPALSFCEKGERGLQKWLDSLPKMNHLDLAKQLLDAGKVIETIDCALNQRVVILEAMQETVLYASSGLKYAHNTHRNQQLELLLHQRFHICYGLLFMNTGIRLLQKELAADKASTQKEQYADYITHASEFLAKTILASKQAYTAVPAKCWFVLHHAFKYQFEHNIVNKNFESTYKAIATLGCAVPERLDAQQCEQIFDMAKAHSKKINIFLEPQEQALFVTDLKTDAEPTFLTKESEQASIVGKSIYFCFKDFICFFLSDSKTALLGEFLQKSLLHNAERLEQREPVNYDISICIGLSRLHHYLACTNSFKDFVSKYTGIQEDNDRFHGKKSEKSNGDIWGSAYKGGQGLENIEAIDFDLPSNQQDIASNLLYAEQVKNLQVINNSNNGVCLLGKRQDFFNVKPSTLIGLMCTDENEYSKSSNWKVAIIRWKQQTSTQCKFGVEIIGHAPKPAAIKIQHSKYSSEFLPALILSSHAAEDSMDSQLVLFTSTGLQNNRSALLAYEKHQGNIILKKRIFRSKELNVYSYKETKAC